MNHALSGCWTKLARSDEHLRALHDEVRDYIKGEPYRILSLLDPQRGRCEFWIEDVREPPLRLGVLLGDYVHNLRSALDHLAWQLALLKYRGRIPERFERQVQYPIANSKAEFLASPAVRHFTPDQRALLKKFQPRKGATHPLTLLRDLSNIDKHRVVHATLVSMGEQRPHFVANDDAVLIDEWYPKRRKIEPQTKIGRVTLQVLGPNPDVNMETLPVRIHFCQAPDRALKSMQNISTDIIERCNIAFFE